VHEAEIEEGGGRSAGSRFAKNVTVVPAQGAQIEIVIESHH
jgi:hypothetical protein